MNKEVSKEEVKSPLQNLNEDLRKVINSFEDFIKRIVKEQPVQIYGYSTTIDLSNDRLIVCKKIVLLAKKAFGKIFF